MLAIHDAILQRTGGERGILHRGGVEAALHRARWGPFDRHGSLLERAAMLIRGIAQDHPFADGNKRTAFAVAENFLLANGSSVVASDDEVVAFMLKVAEGRADVAGIERWLVRHTKAINSPGGS